MKKKDNTFVKEKKEFREHPTVEELYKTIHQYHLVEETLKTTIQFYLKLKESK